MKIINEHTFRKTYTEDLRNTFTGILIFDNGNIMYLKNRRLHREEGPCNCVLNTGCLCLYGTGPDTCYGPAYINTRAPFKEWRHEGKLHRHNGPAIINIAMNKQEYWIHGKKVTKEAQELYFDMIKLKKLI